MSELSERVEQIRASVAELRRAAGGREARRLLDSLFRAVHSFKAAALTHGLSEPGRLAHELENLLHELRAGQVKLDERILRILDETSAALLGANKLPDSERPASLLQTKETASAGRELLALVPAGIKASLKAEQRHRLAEALREGAHLYFVETSFELTDFDLRFQQLRALLEKTGEVIAKAPQVEHDKLNFRIIYTSEAKFNEVRKALADFSAVTIIEPAPLEPILQQAVDAGHAAATATRKEIDFVVQGGELLLDRSSCNALRDALLHLVRNAVDHGIEPADERIKLGKNQRGAIRLEAALVNGETRINVTDDGRGIDPENIPLLFQPGFTTATEVSTLSGRGVGLDVVQTVVEEMGGAVKVTSELGKGSSFEITFPVFRQGGK